jgi:hypothetical protein
MTMPLTTEDRITQLENQVNKLTYLINQLGTALRQDYGPLPPNLEDPGTPRSTTDLDRILYTWGNQEFGVNGIDAFNNNPPCSPLCRVSDYTEQLQNFKDRWLE